MLAEGASGSTATSAATRATPLAKPVAVSPERWRGQPVRFAGLPKVVVARPPPVPDAACDAIAQSGRYRLALPRLAASDRGLRRADRAGRPRTRAAAGRGSSPCSARGRPPARRSSSPAAACRPRAGKHDVPDRPQRPGDVPARGARGSRSRSARRRSRRTPPTSSTSTCRSRRRARLAVDGGSRRPPRARDAGLAMRRVAARLAGALVARRERAAPPHDGRPRRHPDDVLIGGTVPLSGEAAAFGSVGPGAKAYFDYVNSKGGVNGRKIEYRFYDDAYNPAQTVQLTRQLVEQDGVFAIFNSVGTANNLADPRLPERAEGAAALRRRRLGGARRRLGAVPVDGRASCRATAARAPSSGGTSSRRRPRRGSPCCSRTPSSART